MLQPLLMEQVQEQPQPQQQQSALTPELVKDLIELLPHHNPEVRHGTISAILQYTPTSETKLMFQDTPLITHLRKYLFEPKLTTVCLSTLIHFATEGPFLPEYFKLLDPLVLQMKQWQDLELELSLLLLLNISKEEEVVARLLGEEDKKGYLMEILYAILEKNDKMRWIVVGIFVNVSALERGRRFFVEQGMAARFIPFLNSFNQKLREASLKIFRNCAFEWEYEPFLTEVLKPQHQLFPKLVKLATFLICQQTLIHDLTHTKLIMRKLFQEAELVLWEHRSAPSDKPTALAELELAIDIMLILSNSDLKAKKLDVDIPTFKEVLALLKFTDIKEDTKDKLEVLEVFGL